MALRPKKQKKLWIWLVYSRARKRVIACEVGSRDVKTLKKLWKKDLRNMDSEEPQELEDYENPSATSTPLKEHHPLSLL